MDVESAGAGEGEEPFQARRSEKRSSAELSGLKPGLVELIPVSGSVCSSSQETKKVHQAEDRLSSSLSLITLLSAFKPESFHFLDK